MVNLRSKSKTKSAAPNTALKREATDPTPPTVSDNSIPSEATLRKLPRAELQKLAMVHKVKANMKTELIIQQLMSFQRPKRPRPAEDDPEEEPSRKRFKNEATFEGVSIPQDQVERPTAGPATDVPAQASVEDPQHPEAGPSAPQSIPPTQRKPIELSYDKDLFSGTESEMTEEEQLDFATPVSSRSGTPPAANVVNIEHCVTIMRQISAQDVTLLKEVTDVRDTAAKLRKRARDVRDLVKAEKGRRERMETYFRYWQEIEPRWDREWLYGEKMVPDYKINLDDLDEPAGPSTVPVRHNQGAQNLNGERRERPAMQKPALSPEELKRRREEIISKQEAEQRELEALRRNGGFFRFGPSEAAEPPRDLGKGSSSLTDPAPLDENNVDRPLMISLEDSVEEISSALVATSS